MIIRDGYHFLRSYVANLILKWNNPTCDFYPGVQVDEMSALGEHIVLFKNVMVQNSTMGAHTFVQNDSTICGATIGKFCSVASGVRIGLGRHPLKWASTHPAFYSKTQPIAVTFASKDAFEPFQETVIGNDVWIGCNALIKDGVKIGTGAVIAAGAVVVKDVEPYAVVGGVPAQTIKYRFDKTLVQKLLASEWWNMPHEWLQEHHHLMSTPEDFITMFNLKQNERNNRGHAKEA